MTAEKEHMKNSPDLANATTALILLNEWLSIAESQICSTEVLSEHLPKVNALLEKSMNDISTHFGNLANSGRKIDDELNLLIPNIDFVDIDGRTVGITEYIKSIKTSEKETQDKLDKLLAAMQSQQKSAAAEIQNIKQTLANNTAEISEIVVGMQFQDRVSQNIMITINIMKTISEFLDKEISGSLPNISQEERKKLLNKEFTRELLEKFRLGELQHSFVNHLITHGYINDASEVGFSPQDHNQKPDDDDVELF